MNLDDPELPPASLYKYRTLGNSDDDLPRLRQIIVDGKIWWPSPREFNDPFDCSPVIKIPSGRKLKSMAMRLHLRNNPKAPRQARREFLKQSIPGMTRQFRKEFSKDILSLLDDSSLYSLGVDPKNILMWSHYANSHKGVCLRFDANALVHTFKLIAPVEYALERPEVSVGSDEPADLLKKMLLTKSQEWAYEKEWRLLGYRQERGLRTIPKGCLTGVIIGCKASADDREGVRQLALDSEQTIALYQAEQDENVFGINLVPVNGAAEAEVGKSLT